MWPEVIILTAKRLPFLTTSQFYIELFGGLILYKTFFSFNTIFLVFVLNSFGFIYNTIYQFLYCIYLVLYSPLHKYGITPRRSIRRRVFF
jgi:hypothetical protein